MIPRSGGRSRQSIRRASVLAFGVALAVALLVPCGSCRRAPRDSLGLVDHAFSYLYPSASAAFGAVARRVVVLPTEEPQAALYAAVDAAKPRIVYLSPLLAAEIAPLLARDELVRVAYLGPARPATHPRLYSVAFSSDAPARLAAAELAAELSSMGDRGAGATVVALFSGPASEGGAPEAFRSAFEASGVSARLTVERAAHGFSQAIAEALRRLDVRAAYIAAPASELERWASQAFDEYAILAAEAPLSRPEPPPGIDILLCWDVAASLGRLSGLVDRDGGLEVEGSWEAVRSGK